MFTAVLAALVIGCLLYETVPSALLAALCALSAMLLFWLRGHGHPRLLTMDVLAQSSKLNRVHAGLKLGAVLVFIGLGISARSSAAGVFLSVVMLILTVFVGGLNVQVYVHLFSLPLTFLLLSALAILVEVSPRPIGVLNVPVFGIWLCVTAGSRATAALVVSRALGGTSCLYLLSLSTPMPELIGVLRRCHCPKVAINLMYLIYRYLFILLAMAHIMKDAAKSRQGYVDYRTGLHTTGRVYSQLLARSYARANLHFDAMESRCFDDEIRFLENRSAIRTTDVALFGAIGLTALVLSLIA